MECSFPYDSINGSYSRARLDVNKQKIEVYYRKGLCSAPGADCGWEVCVSSELDSNINIVSFAKDRFCPGLLSKRSDLNTSSCENEVLYDTNWVVSKCFAGGYDSVDSQGRTFSVTQNETKCGNSVQRGRVNCFE